MHIEKGPKKSAIIDFLKRNIFHVDNETIDCFRKGMYEKITLFIQSVKKEDLLIDIKRRIWIPRFKFNNDNFDKIFGSRMNYRLLIETEEGVDFQILKKFIIDYEIYKIVFYGKNIEANIFPGIMIEKKEKSFNRCLEISKIEARFNDFNYSSYRFNMKYNPCWGGKIAVTKKGEIKPCIYSSIIIGNLFNNRMEEIFPTILKYWSITKNKIEKCRDCEFRFVCFDCREIAFRETKNLFGSNPYCRYDPYSGKWQICKL